MLGGHRMCFVSAPTELSLSPSSSLSLCISLFVSLSLATNGVHLSGVEHKVADRLSPTLPPDAIRYIPWRIVQEGGG